MSKTINTSKKNNRIIDVDKVVGNKADVAEIRAAIRANLSKIYLSEENLAKLESFGFGRAEILMAHTPNDFISMSCSEVLRDFGIVPFDGKIAFRMMSTDYIVNNYSQLIDLGAKIDFDFIFKDLTRELREYYAEKLTNFEAINYNRLLGCLHPRATFFLADNLMVYGADPMKILVRLDADEIKIHADAFKRHGVKDSVIKARIDKCSRGVEGGVVRRNGKGGRFFVALPVYSTPCLHCKNNHVYYGFTPKRFCTDRCAIVFKYKCEAMAEAAAEIETEQK